MTAVCKKRLKIVLLVLLAVLLLLGSVPAVILHVFINRHCTYRGVETPEYALQGVYSANEFGLDETLHTLTTPDGEQLWVSEIAPEQPTAVLIYISGIMQPSVTYYYGQAKLLLGDNVASFLLEVRSHGRSTGNRLGLGYTEVTDVRTLIDYIRSDARYDGLPILIQGVSMGGAVALNAFGELPEISGCIAMSAYASFEDQLDLLMKQYFVPAPLRAYLLFWLKPVLWLNFSREAVETLRPVDEIRKAGGRLVALIACTGDDSVPVENTYRLADACPEAQVWLRDSWEHFIIQGCDFRNVAEDAEYCAFIRAFIQRIVEA